MTGREHQNHEEFKEKIESMAYQIEQLEEMLSEATREAQVQNRQHKEAQRELAKISSNIEDD